MHVSNIMVNGKRHQEGGQNASVIVNKTHLNAGTGYDVSAVKRLNLFSSWFKA